MGRKRKTGKGKKGRLTSSEAGMNIMILLIGAIITGTAYFLLELITSKDVQIAGGVGLKELFAFILYTGLFVIVTARMQRDRKD